MNKIIVYDIDGTVANNDHRQHWVATNPKNWKAFFAAQDKDVPYDDIVWTLRQYEKDKHTIIFASGRSEEYRNVTVSWLVKHNIPFHGLYLRPENDNRSDSIVKVDLLNRIRQDHGEVFLWFDDRTQVVNAIREQGVRVLQVRPGDF